MLPIPKGKQDTLTSLYALRAGLSMMSMVYDEYKTVEGGIIQADKRIKSANQRKSGAPKIQRDKMQNYSDKIDKAKSTVYSCKRDLKYSKSERREYGFPLLLGLLALGAVAFLVIFLFKRDYSASDFASKFWVFVTHAAVGAASLFASIFGICLVADSLPKWIEAIGDVHYNKSKKKDAVSELRELTSARKTNFANFSQEHAETIAKTDKDIAEAQSIIATEKPKLPIIKARFDIVYQAVQKEFASVIDERDWPNVDLIIFNYETGRALDLRDALMQVDMERRNERLIAAVNAATSTISNTIRQGFGEMTAMLENKFNELSSSISSLSSNMSSLSQNFSRYASASLSQGQAINSSLNQLNVATSASIALQKKISVSSSRMTEEISALRTVTSDGISAILRNI